MSWSAIHRLLGIVRAPRAQRRAALSSHPLEALRFPEQAAAFVAGGRETAGALPVKTAYFEGAVFSSRGRRYASYNEDAAGIFYDRSGALYVCVLDQVGGLGGTKRSAASLLVGLEIADTFQRVASASALLDAGVVLDELSAAFDRGHQHLLDRHEGEVTTAIAAIVRPGELLIASSGDSGAALFGSDGTPRSATRPQKSVRAEDGYLEHALGLVRDGHGTEQYLWPMNAGDWLVIASDGLLDSGLGPGDVGRHLLSGAESAANSLARSVLRRMTLGLAKPDNLSIAVIRAAGGKR